MDFFLPIVLFIVFCVLFSICGWCCKKHRDGTIYGVPTATVTVTQPVSQNIPPYPVDPRHQQPLPPAGFVPNTGYQSGAYQVPPISPYPPAPAGGYPPATPYPTAYPPPHVTPYPPTAQNFSQLPPSYTEAVGQPPAEPRPPLNDGYSKQAPYNPNY
ncbi:hypothetical protein FQR65_LT03036 [Abscondita terminalis]|nr:hypothetical protein FQR65_LT03036 [Abscondita terminalis]